MKKILFLLSILFLNFIITAYSFNLGFGIDAAISTLAVAAIAYVIEYIASSVRKKV